MCWPITLDMCNVDWEASAAWVQAVGSVLAILVAARLLIFEQRAARLARIEGVDGVITTASNHIERVTAAVRDSGHRTITNDILEPDPIKDIQRMLEAVAAHELASLTLPGHILRMQALLRDFEAEVASARASNGIVGTPHAHWAALYDLHQRALDIVVDISTIVDGARRHRDRWWQFWRY